MSNFFRHPGVRTGAAFLAGALTTLVIHAALPPSSLHDGLPLRDLSTDYTFVKPLLACNVGATNATPSLALLKTSFENIIQNAKNTGAAKDVAVYFRSLNSGEWTGVDIDSPFSPASLMKVPILMTYLSMEERNELIGAAEIVYTGDGAQKEPQNIAPEVTLEPGVSYSVDMLLDIMTAYSDNRARDLLMEYVDITTLTETLSDLGIPLPNGDANAYTVSPRLYSRLFRILYNATYLTATSSERALDMLARTTYNDGLRAQIPNTVAIAHKFGEIETHDADGAITRELHDCGIVYTDEPYTLCIMTRGTNTDALASVITELSNAAYTFVTRP